MFDFKEIETFYWVATMGSFRAAAAKLNTTQPAISQRIAGLEQALGARVLSREARIAAPTTASAHRTPSSSDSAATVEKS